MTNIYAIRRKKFFSELPNNSFAIFSAGEFNFPISIIEFGWKPHPEYYYLTGLHFPVGILIITKSSNGTIDETLFLAPINKSLEAWDGKMLDEATANKISEIEQIKTTDTLAGFLTNIAKKFNQLYVQQSKSAFGYALGSYEQFIGKIQSNFPALQLASASKILNYHRLVKDKTEIELIQQAIDKTEVAFKNSAQFIKAGMYEYQVEASLIYQYLNQGCSNHAFKPIIASGLNSCFLHYNSSKDILQKDQVILIDSGACCNMYNSDITRVFPIGGKFTDQAEEIYEINLEVQTEVLAKIKAKMTLREIFNFTIEIQQKLLKKHKIIKQDKEYKEYTVHNLGHPLGLDVHDPMDIDYPLPVDAVITVEPGLYFPAKNIGIRIEDNVLIKKDGVEVLSKKIPKQVKDIYKLMSGK